MWNRSGTPISIIKLNINLRKQCEFFGFSENPENESILIFHSCSTNRNVDKDQMDTFGRCNELHIGNTPRSIMTKGISTRRKNRLPGSLYGNLDPGNNDKLMISYKRVPSHDYTMWEACGVLFEGEIHFFGGSDYTKQNWINLTRQHFVIETQRKGQQVEMTKKEDLEMGFWVPACSSFEMTSEYFPWFKTNFVVLCFDWYHKNSCYSFDGTLTHIVDSNYKHFKGALTKYESNILTVGGWDNQKTELLKIDENKNFNCSVVEPDFKFTPGNKVYEHSMVTIESSDINEEYVLLTGGYNDRRDSMGNVFKFNRTWFSFGQLKKPRFSHNSIYWNGAVYVIGGAYREGSKTKMEIWNIKDSQNQFKTTENWPELLWWSKPHLFIVPDSFFPDH